MQGEYLPGYFGRLAILNDYSNVTDLHMYLSRKTYQKIARKAPILMCLSKLLEIDAIHLWESFTVYTIKLKQFNTKNIRKKLETSHDSTRNKKDSTAFMPTFFCSKCIQDDFDKYGYTFWRKDHQTLESEFCNNHQGQSLLTAIENERLYYSPAWHLKYGKYDNNYSHYFQKHNK